MTEAAAREGIEPVTCGASVDSEPSLRTRDPSYSVIRECLGVQQQAAPLGPYARLIGRSPLHPAARRLYRGALGEIEVAGVLSRLGAEWTVLHAVPIGSGRPDVDHVVIGPAGIFTIDTKNHADQKIVLTGSDFTANGEEQNHARDALHRAERASRLVSGAAGRPVPVTPLIVVVNPASIAVGRTRPAVTVLSSSGLRRWLDSRPRVMSARAVAYFSTFAEERCTWHSQPVVNDDPIPSLQRFDDLRREVDAAKTRSTIVLLAVIAAFILCIDLLLPGILPLVAGLFPIR
jgi:hypothetical protein